MLPPCSLGIIPCSAWSHPSRPHDHLGRYQCFSSCSVWPTGRDDENGASAVEYGLLVAAIAAIIVLIVFAIGKFVQEGFQDTCDGLSPGRLRRRHQRARVCRLLIAS